MTQCYDMDHDLEAALAYVEMFLDHIDCDHEGDHPARDEIKEFLDRMNAWRPA